MRLSSTGHKIFTRKGLEGYSVKQILFAAKIRRDIGEDFWLRVRLGEMTEEEENAAKKIMKHRGAGWWIQRRHGTIWSLLKEQREKETSCKKQ